MTAMRAACAAICPTVKGCEYGDCYDFTKEQVMAPAGRRPAVYQRVADDLLRRIRDGEFPPGSRLPTEPQLMARYEVSSTTVRSAVKTLAAMGVIETRHGSGSFVVERQLLTIYATTTEDLDRRAGVTSQDSWSTDVIAAGRTPSQRFECLNVSAPETAARLMGVEQDAPLVMRRCWRSVDGQPASIEASLYPRLLVDRLPLLASPRDIAQGTTSYMAENGHPIGWYRDHLAARPMTREEAAFFEAPAGVTALVRLRVAFEERGGQVLRLTENVYRSDMHEVVYEVAGRGNPAVDPA
jgi:GntR family transcriptional regulator